MLYEVITTPFKSVVDYYQGPDGKTWEPSATMRNSVRRIDDQLFDQLAVAGGIAAPATRQAGTSHSKGGCSGTWYSVGP